MLDLLSVEPDGSADDVLDIGPAADLLHAHGLVLEHFVVQEESLQFPKPVRTFWPWSPVGISMIAWK
jgi:hypothetical protein